MVLVLETIVLDQVMLFGTDQIQIFAISSAYEEIRHRLLKELEAGVTMTMIETTKQKIITATSTAAMMIRAFLLRGLFINVP